MLVEEDANSPKDSTRKLFHASADAGKKLYKQGKFAESEMPNVDTYLLRKVLKSIHSVDTYENTQLEWLKHLPPGWFIPRCCRAQG